VVREDAIARAKVHAEQQGWSWREPVHAETCRPWLIGAMRWRVVSNYGVRGMNARIEIDDATGEIVKSSYVPR
jgi:hypothetical protein